MAMDHAQIRRDIWADEDFRDLPAASQWLYLHILTSPTLSYCGVADWRPARIAALTADWSSLDVERAAVELEMNHYLVIDRETEEALVRSFVKHDGLMGKWNMAAALARAYGEVASKAVRGVIVHELHRLKDTEPRFKAWERPDVIRVMGKPNIAPTDALEMVQPNVALCTTESPSESPKERGNESPDDQGKETPSDWGCPTPSPSPTPNSRLSKSPSKVTSPSERVSKRKADDSRLAELRAKADKEAS